VRVADHPAHLALIGCARSASSTDQAVIVADFGQSTIKLGVAHYLESDLVRIDISPSISATSVGIQERASSDGRGLDLIRQSVIEVLSGYWQQQHATNPAIGPVFQVSLATYLNGVGPADYWRGPYTRLNKLGSGLESSLAQGIEELIHRPVQLALMHDGTAAAQTCADVTGTAVIMMGTALGWGIPSAKRSNRAIDKLVLNFG
jgi:hypothetical protein